MLRLLLPDVAATEKLAIAVARGVGGLSVVTLTGPMGAGKTTFVKGLARGIGIDELVVSPTFVLMNEYVNGRMPMYHVDLYRMGESLEPATPDAEQVLKSLDFLVLELDELAAGESLIVVEWADLLRRHALASNFLSQHDHLAIDLSYVTNNDSARLATIEAVGDHFAQVVCNIKDGFGDMIRSV